MFSQTTNVPSNDKNILSKIIKIKKNIYKKRVKTKNYKKKKGFHFFEKNLMFFVLFCFFLIFNFETYFSFSP
jgi:hypothetical protein